MIIRNAALAGVCLAMFAVATPAAAQTVNAFTTQNVIQALQGLGVAGEARVATSPDGNAEYVAFEINGLKHVAMLEVCNTGAAGCLGLHLMTLWNDVPGVDVNILNEFNFTYSFSKAVGMNGNMAIARYAISDGGVSMKNVQSNISNHVGNAVNFMEFYRNASGAATVSLDAKAARPKPVQVSAAPGFEGLAPLLDPNDFNAAPTKAALPEATHAAPR